MVNHKSKKHEYFLKKYPEFEHSISRFNDYIERVLHNQKIVETRFLLSIEQTILNEMMDSEIELSFSGGFENANYQKALMIPKAFPYQALPEVLILTTNFNSEFESIQHKDVLGAIMNQGIARDCIGDILIDENRIYVACDKTVEQLLKMMARIKRVNIQFENFTGHLMINLNLQRYEKIISSMRLDVIVAALANLSRTAALEVINSGAVRVNQIVRSNKAYLCNLDDEIVIRKYGKFRLCSIKSKTKKGNIIIEVDKYV